MSPVVSEHGITTVLARASNNLAVNQSMFKAKLESECPLDLLPSRGGSDQ
jgi:hypothetical protein